MKNVNIGSNTIHNINLQHKIKTHNTKSFILDVGHKIHFKFRLKTNKNSFQSRIKTQDTLL